MAKKRKNSRKNILKILFMVCVIAILVGIGESQNGWKNIKSDGINAIIYNANQIISGEHDSNKTAQEDTEDSNLSVQSGDLTIYFFDVGQADSTLLIDDDEVLLIDAGNNNDGELLVKQLKSLDIDKIDYLIGTHAHEDHIGGIDNVINNFEVEKFLMPFSDYDSATYRSVIEAADKNKISKDTPNIGDFFYIGDAKCEVMSVDPQSQDANLSSIVIEVTYGKNKFLFMADAEIENEEIRLWNDVDVLKVGHHGSSTSTSEDFLMQTKPETAIISVGKDNSYGHPHTEIIEILEDYNVTTYRTDEDGTIKITSNGETYDVQTFDISLDGK